MAEWRAPCLAFDLVQMDMGIPTFAISEFSASMRRTSKRGEYCLIPSENSNIYRIKTLAV